VELRSSVVVAIAGERLEQRLVERDDGRIRDEDFTELLEATLKTVILVFEVLKRSDLGKLLRKSNHEYHTDQLYALFHGTCRSRSSLRY